MIGIVTTGEPPPLAIADVRPPGADEFRLFQRLIYREAGIFLGPSKKELLFARLRRRLRARGTRSFLAYYRLVKRELEERTRMLDCISTQETQFFRQPRQFKFLEQRVLADLRAAAGRRSRSLRLWSAGCATGQEPYSLAMTLLYHLPGWRLDVLATDLSTRALEQAQAAVWPIDKAAEIPLTYRKRFMLRGIRGQAGTMKAGPEIRSMVRFARLNLHHEIHPRLGLFDLIFCRNVLIYFNAESRARAVRRLLRHLAPGGVLFLGHAESLSSLSTEVRSVGPNAYVRAVEGGRPAAGVLR